MTIAQIAPKNTIGHGVVSSSRCNSAVATSALIGMTVRPEGERAQRCGEAEFLRFRHV
ncbi:MAG: hypothetical protein QOG46_902 [Pseudonocardiales bacterium]|jgi:hypothetical protein|nr:hypothetical protein [Pseudonocardiales bacterium]